MGRQLVQVRFLPMTFADMHQLPCNHAQIRRDEWMGGDKETLNLGPPTQSVVFLLKSNLY